MMNELVLNVLSRIQVNNKGVVTFDYVPAGTISSSVILPYHDLSLKQDYGIEVKTSHRIFTEDKEKIKTLDFLEHNGKKYVINYLIDFPEYAICILELVK
jgi:hypothetical protein